MVARVLLLIGGATVLGGDTSTGTLLDPRPQETYFHSTGSLPTLSGAICLNAAGLTSISPGLHPPHLSVTLTFTDFPADEVIRIHLPHEGELFGFGVLMKSENDRAATSSSSECLLPHALIPADG